MDSLPEETPKHLPKRPQVKVDDVRYATTAKDYGRYVHLVECNYKLFTSQQTYW